MQRISKEKNIKKLMKKYKKGKRFKVYYKEKIIWSSIWKLVRFIEYWILVNFKALFFRHFYRNELLKMKNNETNSIMIVITLIMEYQFIIIIYKS